MLWPLASFCSAAIPEFRIQFMLNASETFMRLASLIQWTQHFAGAFMAASKSWKRAGLVKPDCEHRDLRGGKSVRMVFCISS